MRAESAGPNGGTQVFVFDGGAKVMRMIDYDKKSYAEMTKADMDRMGAQMEAMMKGRGMPGMSAPAKTEYRKAGTDKVGKWTCDKYGGCQDNQKTSELCTVDPTALGFTADDFQVSAGHTLWRGDRPSAS